MVDGGRPDGVARMVVVTGLPGAGKTTLAVRLASALQAVRLCPDDWMVSADIELWDRDARTLIEGTQRAIAAELLEHGRHVVVEFGSWTRAEREELRLLARLAGAAVELRYVTAPVDELHQRLADRPHGSRLGPGPVGIAELLALSAVYEVPTADEFAGFDAPFDLPR